MATSKSLKERYEQIANLANVSPFLVRAIAKKESNEGGNVNHIDPTDAGVFGLNKASASLFAKNRMDDKDLAKYLKGLSNKEYRKWVSHHPKKVEELVSLIIIDAVKDAKKFGDGTEGDIYAVYTRGQGGARKFFKNRDPKDSYSKVTKRRASDFQKIFDSFSKKSSQPSSNEQTEVDLSDPYKIPHSKEEIKSWMKQHGWTGKDLGQMVDGKWVGYHPGDTISKDGKFEDVEEFEEFKAQQEPKVATEATVDTSVDSFGGNFDEEAAVQAGLRETKSIMEEPEVPVNNDEAIEYSKIRDTGGYEDPTGGDLPSYKHGGHVRKYNGGGQVLTAEDGGGGVLPEEDFTSYSVEELQEAQERYPIGSVQRARINELVGLRMRSEKYEPHSGYKWGGQKDPTGVGASFESSEIVETDDKGLTDDQRRDTYLYMRGLPTPGASGTHPSKEHLVAGVEESELTPLDPTKSPDYSVMDRTLAGKEPGAQIADTKKTPTKKAPPVTKTKSQAEIDAEQELAKAKEEDAWLDQQKRSIAAEIQKFNDEQTELVKIDPDRFWKNKGTVSKIVAIIGAAGGAYLSARYGGPNEWQQTIDREITKDIEAQKLDRDHAVKKKLAAQKRIEMMMKHYEFMTKDKTAKANLAIAREKLKNARLKGTANLIREQQAARDATAMGKGMTDQELAIYNARYPKENVRKRAVKSTKDGKWYVFPDESMKKKVLENVNAGEKSIQNIKELKALVNDVGLATILPGPFQELDPRLKKAKVLRESLKGALRLEIFGPGVMTDTERALADQIIGDPSKLFTRDKTQIEMLDTLQAKINYGMRQQLKRAGIKVPPDQNELKIKEMLAQRGWTDDNGENRAKVVNALIKLEQKHKTGNYWKFDSQIPL